jgi:hypothetical protein
VRIGFRTRPEPPGTPRKKCNRRIFSRFDKLDVVFLAFLNSALIVEAS